METTTAITLIAQGDVAERINEIRSKYDAAWPRWMPHINFVFPGVPFCQFAAVASALKPCLEKVGEFELEFREIGSFKRRKDFTFHLKPVRDDKLQEIMKIITDTVPGLGKSKHGGVFCPHLTIGQGPPAVEDELKAWLARTFKEKIVKFKVGQIHLIRREGQEPFAIHTSLALSSSSSS